MASILGISGSLRKGSYNTALLRQAQKLVPGVIVLGDIRNIPLYDGDVENAGTPASVLGLKQKLETAAGLLIASPEYNNSVPGVLKNTIDWLSRPSGELKNVFRNKPVAVFGASPGGFGTVMAQSAWLPVFRSLGARHWCKTVRSSRVTWCLPGRSLAGSGRCSMKAVNSRITPCKNGWRNSSRISGLIVKLEFFTCDVFTRQRFGGNPLAVVADARGLTPEQMQHVAREFNYSETTFVFPPERGFDRKIRIFTPAREVPFAGHPNIGTAFVLASNGLLEDRARDSVTGFGVNCWRHRAWNWARR